MRITPIAALLALSTLQPAAAGCIGPVIMGECQGTTTAWDTHSPSYQPAQPAPPGFYYDKRGLPQDQQQPGAVNPFIGRDAHDANQDHNTYKLWKR